MEKIIEIRGLNQHFPSGPEIFRNLDFAVEKGDCTAIVGPNGSGKTSFLRILTTLALPKSGEVKIFGKSIWSDGRHIRKDIGWVPATDAGFFPRLTGAENLRAFAAIKGLGKRQTSAEIQEWKTKLPIAEALGTPYYLCSSGMKQALGICRALLGHPPLVLLDEPTRSLDTKWSESLRSALSELKKKSTIVFASHNRDDWERLATNRWELKDKCLRPLKP